MTRGRDAKQRREASRLYIKLWREAETRSIARREASRLYIKLWREAETRSIASLHQTMTRGRDAKHRVSTSNYDERPRREASRLYLKACWRSFLKAFRTDKALCSKIFENTRHCLKHFRGMGGNKNTLPAPYND